MVILYLALILSAPVSPPTSAAAPTTYKWIELDPVGEDLVPPAPRYKLGLPGQVLHQGGTWLPSPLDDAVREMSYYCTERYQGVIEVAIQEATRAAMLAEAARCDGRLRVQGAKCLADATRAEIGQGRRWTTWTVIGVALAGVLAGTGIGAALVAAR